MAGPMAVLDVTYKAEVDLSSSQYCAVVHSSGTDGQVKLPSGESAGKVAGILQNEPEINEAARVRKLGISTGVASGSISRGDNLEVANSSGHLQTALTIVGTLVGTAEMDAADGDEFELFVNLVEFSGTSVTFSSSSSSSSSTSSSSSSSSMSSSSSSSSSSS